VYDAGAQENYLFVVMEYFAGKNLADALLDVPSSEVRSIIAQIASGAQFLEEASFAHRDIKPENIGISPDMKTGKLIDFGVLRPFDLTNITDEGEQRYFIGTLRYSPPELLFREEEQSLEAWRAITFYQLGAVLYDLLMRRPLFEEFKNPYGRCVRAIEKEIPIINNPAADPDLRLLAQNCLAKNPVNRLDTVKWDDFSQRKDSNPLAAARKKIAQYKVVANQAADGLSSKEDLINAQIFSLRKSIFGAIIETIKTESYPRYSMQDIKEFHPYLLKVLFEPSAKNGLGCYFAIYCQGKIIGPEANLRELRIWACVSSTSEAIPIEPESTSTNRRLVGVLLERDIRQFIQECLLFAYADALDIGTNKLEKVEWLNLENGK
jgi:serine/threonine protein kinase